jgi:hypothetical protein
MGGCLGRLIWIVRGRATSVRIWDCGYVSWPCQPVCPHLPTSGCLHWPYAPAFSVPYLVKCAELDDFSDMRVFRSNPVGYVDIPLARYTGILQTGRDSEDLRMVGRTINNSRKCLMLSRKQFLQFWWQLRGYCLGDYRFPKLVNAGCIRGRNVPSASF